MMDHASWDAGYRAGRRDVLRPYGIQAPTFRLCTACGSPDVREVEREARSTETSPHERSEWRCIDCGWTQTNE